MSKCATGSNASMPRRMVPAVETAAVVITAKTNITGNHRNRGPASIRSSRRFRTTLLTVGVSLYLTTPFVTPRGGALARRDPLAIAAPAA
ncbi:MAG: hypothetical protein P8Z67_05775, partial [Gammaproteobacteria bacterium]